ncbi:hypothetical protein JD292_08515 [Leucobacter sp. CSA2]|uniref:Di-and tripeptidase n=1 Tax=Leucobacter edaphi TaxID=2796472 RepID=A0A934UYG4_9MICO|nr:hypothetical protein [Leucobacter edaphi]MBK0422117.1 hypothetical protein [Leucobacter edaphi]
MDQEKPLESGVAARIVDRALDRVLVVQGPLVRAHVKRATAKRPNAAPEDLVRLLERQFLTTVTVGGGAVGAAAAVPGVGTATALAISGAETVGFVEATALFAHSVTELHGITRVDPDRAQTLVLTLMLGQEGLSLLRQVSGQATGGPGRNAFWGEFLTSSLPRQAVGPLLDRLRADFVKRLAKVGTASVIGKAIPYGVGAVVGGTGNHLLGRGVVRASRKAFGPAPLILPDHLRFEATPWEDPAAAGDPAAEAGESSKKRSFILPSRLAKQAAKKAAQRGDPARETIVLQAPAQYAPPQYAPPQYAAPQYAPPQYAPRPEQTDDPGSPAAA